MEGLRVCEPPGSYPIQRRSLARQEDIDQLEGCERIDYDLAIGFEGADLRPLRALREVRGRLIIGDEYGYSYSRHGFASLEGLEGLPGERAAAARV